MTQRDDTIPPLLKAAEAAELLGISLRTFRTVSADLENPLPRYLIGKNCIRYSRRDILAWAKSAAERLDARRAAEAPNPQEQEP